MDIFGYTKLKNEGGVDIMNTVKDKKKIIQQKMNRLKEQESKIKIKERKQRTRQLIQFGGLVDKVSLSHLSTSQLLGALIEIKSQSEDDENLKRWTQLGDDEFNRNKTDSDKEKPITIKFNEEPEVAIRKKLRSFGMRWNSVRKEWEGISDPERIQEELKGVEGMIVTELEIAA
jgi:hypothetical protein